MMRSIGVRKNTTGGVRMKEDKRFFVLAIIFIFSLGFEMTISGQDALPSEPLVANNSTRTELPRGNNEMENIASPEYDFPSEFYNTSENTIRDEDFTLGPIFKRLADIHTGRTADTLRVVHIGDSHVRGLYYPRMIGNLLTETFGSLIYTDLGVNGATCCSFARSKKMAKVFAAKPDLVIISFGTNESYGRHYDSDEHYQQIDQLVSLLKANLPNVKLLFTTPPGSYFRYKSYKTVRLTSRKRRKRYRRVSTVLYKENPHNDAAVATICKYAKDHSYSYWNLYKIAGGDERACLNWADAQLMRPDHVHYIPDGYRLQGKLLYQAFIKAYNNYVSR